MFSKKLAMRNALCHRAHGRWKWPRRASARREESFVYCLRRKPREHTSTLERVHVVRFASCTVLERRVTSAARGNKKRACAKQAQIGGDTFAVSSADTYDI